MSTMFYQAVLLHCNVCNVLLLGNVCITLPVVECLQTSGHLGVSQTDAKPISVCLNTEKLSAVPPTFFVYLRRWAFVPRLWQILL